MMNQSFRLIGGLTVGALLFALPVSKAVAAATPTIAIAPVGETKPFHGTLRAKDMRLGTLSLGSTKKITRILALDPASRLNKGLYPATLADFAIGDVVEGFAFPDPLGRMVVAVATATAPPLGASEAKGKKKSRPHKPRTPGLGRHHAPAPLSPTTAKNVPTAATPSMAPKPPLTKPRPATRRSAPAHIAK